MKQAYIECSCYMELILLQYEEEYDNLYLSIYSFGVNNYPVCWKQRLRHIWRIITKGTPWAGQLPRPKGRGLKEK